MWPVSSSQATSSSISSSTALPTASVSAAVGQIRKGLLWQQRDRIFSRWKERFFVLTKDYLQCFKKGSSRISEMGGFIFKIRLAEVRRFGKYILFASLHTVVWSNKTALGNNISQTCYSEHQNHINRPCSLNQTDQPDKNNHPGSSNDNIIKPSIHQY
jgi:hypothetical protein